MTTKQVYIVLNTQRNYKLLFEQKFGRTGFGL